MPIGNIVLTPDAAFAGGTTPRRFAAVAVFGDGVYAGSLAGTKLTIPVPFAVECDSWFGRLLTSGSATFAVSVASSIAAAAAGVGGTAPAVSAALGAQSLSLDWSTVVIPLGGVLEVELVSVSGALGAALTISGTLT